MIDLLTTTSVLRLVTSTSATVDVTARYMDGAPGVQVTAISSATTTTIVSAPSAASAVAQGFARREVSEIAIANRHASTAVIVQVQLYDGTTAYQIVSETLYAGDSLVYNEYGWTTKHTQASGIAGTTLGNVCNIPIGNTAYASIGTDGVHTAGTLYYSEIFLPANKTVTGIAVLNGTVVGTDKLILALASSTGAILANTALAGATGAGADDFQEIALTATYAAVGPARYFLILQCNGTTHATQKIAASTYRNWTGSVAGVFGTLAAITPPTSTAADKGPVGYLY